MTVYDSIPVTVTGGTLSDAEIEAQQENLSEPED